MLTLIYFGFIIKKEFIEAKLLNRRKNMNDTLTKIKNGKPVKAVKRFLSWRYFPFITAALSLLNYYTGLDIFYIYYFCITGTLILLISDDSTPLISNLILMAVMISRKNSTMPLMGGSAYYSSSVILTQIIILLSIHILALIYRLAKTIKQGNFKFTPIFFGLCAFAAVLLLNGLFSDGYKPKNLLYGLIMAACFLGVFAAMKDNVNCSKESFINVAYSFVALSGVLLIELLVTYLTTEGIIENGTIQRTKLVFGWGTYNQAGMMHLICLPPILFLAGKQKYGYLFSVYALAATAGTIFTMSRQAMLGLIIILPLCVIILIITGRNRLANIIIAALALLGLAVILGVLWSKILLFFESLKSSFETGSGRTLLWKQMFANFKSAPFLGVGFYVRYDGYSGQSGLGFLPHMCHNTVFELLGACGICGLIAYVAHRIQTIICYFKNVTPERTFIAITVLAILILSLLDNHIFNIFPTIIYSCFIAMLVKSEKAENKLQEAAMLLPASA